MKELILRDYEEQELRRRAASDEELNIRLTNNYAFQKIFKNKDIVKGFLMALLHLKEKQIKDIEIVDPITSGEESREKEGILDFNQMKSPGYYHKISLMDKETNESYSRKFQFHVIELKKLGQAKGKAKKQSLYRWAKLIAASTWEEIEIESEGNRYMERALDEMIKMSQDEVERYLYLREEMAESDRISQLESAKDIGREEGRKEGRKEGREEGERIGEERLANLLMKLSKQNRQEDSIKALEDLEYRKKLYEEFGV